MAAVTTRKITLNSARRVTRTVFAGVVGVASMVPLIYSAASERSPEQAVGWSALLLTIAGGITRIMAVPAVELWLQKFVPFLAANPDTEGTVARRALIEPEEN